VDPGLEIKGYALLYNPTAEELQRKIRLPLYYTGLTETASVQIGDGESIAYPLSRDFCVEIEVKIPAHGYLPVLIK